MLAKIWSVGIKATDGFLVSVEVDVAPGLPTLAIVGLPEAEVRESKERVVAAIRNSGYDFPLKRITVNLGPAEIKKTGTHFDLPIAAGILAASGQLTEKAVAALSGVAVAGELGLDGVLRPVAGILPMLSSLEKNGITNSIVPNGNAGEAAITGAPSRSAGTLRDFAEYLEGRKELPGCVMPGSGCGGQAAECGDFAEVKGQALAKRALEIAAAGGHNLLMVGPPGSGKSMLAKRFPGILPPMTKEEALESTSIYSVCGLLGKGALLAARPFRDPHHTISDIALIGGGANPRPGEVSLAHNGVLFLDELPEFSRASLEVLREPLENFRVTISRAKETASFPARFTLIAAMNPCPCGYCGHPDRACSCSPVQIKRYRFKISGPLLDRIDLSVQLSPVKYEDWKGPSSGETSSAVKDRVLRARAAQAKRFAGSALALNAHMGAKQLRQHCRLPDDGGLILETAMKKMGLSARSLDKIVKVARTIADLEGCGDIARQHLMEVMQYRLTDRTVIAE